MDVYGDSPTIVTVWLSVLPKLSILILLLEIYLQIDSLENYFIISNFNIGDIFNNLSGNNALNNLLFISSLLSLIIGTVLGLAQSQIKRLMAYSTISHLGFILLALSINTEESLDSFLFYIVQYTITNLNVFLIILAFNYLLSSLIKNNIVIKDVKYISELTNQFEKNPILTLSFIICLLSMAGIPPFIGFYSKLFVLFSAISISEYFISIVAILVSVISAYYYLRIIKVLYTEENKTSNLYQQINVTENNFISNTKSILTNLHSLIISVISLFLLLFFLNPVLILTSTRVLSLSLFNY